jgi:hypothetical protein
MLMGYGGFQIRDNVGPQSESWEGCGKRPGRSLVRIFGAVVTALGVGIVTDKL